MKALPFQLSHRDLIIGLAVSVLLHGAFFLAGPSADGRPVVVNDTPDDNTIDVYQMPVIEPDEPEVFEVSDDAPPEPLEMPVPTQADVLTVAVEQTFVQELQPPPPPVLNQAHGVIMIPISSARPAGQNMGNIFDLASLDQPPSARFQSNPVYPFEMRRAGITGEVLVGFIVDANGDVRDPYPVRSTQREFEAAAVQAVSKWKFRPGRKAGRAVNTRMQVPIVFSITD